MDGYAFSRSFPVGGHDCGNRRRYRQSEARGCPTEGFRSISLVKDRVTSLWRSRVLPFDAPTAETAGALMDLARSRGHSPGFADIAIAATARRYRLTILSRNERHFAPMDVAVVNPFQELPSGK